MIDERSAIAVVDSDESFRERVRDLLEAVGLTVELFGSAEEYLRTSNSHLPSCAVLEVRLPGMGGLDLQSRIARAGHKTPLVFLTALDDVRTCVRAIKAGAIDFLTKPFRAEELLEAVRNGIEYDRARRAESETLDELRTRLASLSLREREMMVLLSAGQEPKQIAGQIGICTHTARVHRSRVLAKMGARSIVDLARMADRLGHLSSERVHLIETKRVVRSDTGGMRTRELTSDHAQTALNY